MVGIRKLGTVHRMTGRTEAEAPGATIEETAVQEALLAAIASPFDQETVGTTTEIEIEILTATEIETAIVATAVEAGTMTMAVESAIMKVKVTTTRAANEGISRPITISGLLGGFAPIFQHFDLHSSSASPSRG